MKVSTAARRIVTRRLSFKDRESLFEALAARARLMRGKTSILAGHYMLLYRPEERRLVPLMRSVVGGDPGATPLEREYLGEVGDFPEATFELGARLVAEDPSAERRLVLLVNDIRFQLVQRGLPEEEALGALKRDYYWSHEGPPRPFAEILERHGLDDAAFERNDAERHARSTLPPETVFFSENVLKRRFLTRRRDWVLQHPGFTLSGGVSGVPKVIYRSEFDAARMCVIDEEGDCGCSGTTIERLLQLAERGARNVVMFIPEECRLPVHASVQASMSALVNFDSVVAVWGDAPGPEGESALQSATVYEPGE